MSLNLKECLNKDVVVLWSGGIDSTGLIFVLLRKYNCKIHPIFVKHGQRNEEYEEKAIMYYSNIFSKEFADKFQTPFIATSYIPAKEFKEKKFTNRHFLRNSDLINNAVRYAIHNDIRTILIATSEGDFLDGQPKFLNAKVNEIKAATDLEFNLLSPFFCNDFECSSKVGLINFCKEADFDLSFTRSCYEKLDKPCGKCDTCKIREDAFSKSGG